MNLAVLASPWGVVLALAAYRLTRLWIDDMIPPLPRIRAAIDRWAVGRYELDREHAATADLRDPAHQAEMDAADARALRGGYQAARVVGPREEAVQERLHLSGGQPALTYLITCYWCAGFWIALAVAVVGVLLPIAVWALPFGALALSAIVGLLAKIDE